jgi:hypothetical protein
MAVDIESYSSRTMPEQVDLQNRLLWTAVQACHLAGIKPARCDRQDSGDGEILILPPGIDEQKVLPGFVAGLLGALVRVNEAPGAGGRMRLRVSLGQGAIQKGATGYPSRVVIVVARLLDCAELRQALKDNQSADAAVIVTSDLYQDVFVQGYGGLPPGDFREVHVNIPAKKFSDIGWIQVPARPPLLTGIPAYRDNPVLLEQQHILALGAAGVATAAALAWAAFAGSRATPAGSMEATLTGLVSHSDLLPPGMQPFGDPEYGGVALKPAGPGHDAAAHPVAQLADVHHETGDGDALAGGHHGQAQQGNANPGYGSAAATDSARTDPDTLPTDTQAAVSYGTDLANRGHAGIAAELIGYTEIYGNLGYDSSVTAAAEVVRFTEGNTHGVAYEQAVEYRTPDGIELVGREAWESGAPGHETEGYTTAEYFYSGSEATGYELTGYETSTHEEDRHGYGEYQVGSYESDHYESGHDYDTGHLEERGTEWM